MNSEIMKCKRCRLHETRTNAVPGEGPMDARVMFVGEGPGKKEDEKGRPFVGRAGELLNEMLLHADLSREQVFITNIVKCRPPGNRDPREDEKKTCSEYLSRQIEIIKPRAICTLGNHATSHFLGVGEMGKRHGRTFQVEQMNVIPLYHPAAALYNPNLKGVMKEDFLSLRKILY